MGERHAIWPPHVKEVLLRPGDGIYPDKDTRYAGQLNQQIVISIDSGTRDYFIAQSQDTGIPCQTLINLYLKDCAYSRRKLHISDNG